jgi:pyruvate-ferredoxin/flavodoxin oxidoreductase
VADFASSEVRFASLARSKPEHAKYLLELLEADTAERWRYYSQLAGIERTSVVDGGGPLESAGVADDGGD